MRTFITVTGLQIYAYHGLFTEEQTLGQKFAFDVRAELAAARSHDSDDLTQSVRYDALVNESVKIAQAGRCQTLEALGERIARGLLLRFPALVRICVNVAKLSPPIPHPMDRVAVEVHLERAELESAADPAP